MVCSHSIGVVVFPFISLCLCCQTAWYEETVRDIDFREKQFLADATQATAAGDAKAQGLLSHSIVVGFTSNKQKPSRRAERPRRARRHLQLTRARRRRPRSTTVSCLVNKGQMPSIRLRNFSALFGFTLQCPGELWCDLLICLCRAALRRARGGPPSQSSAGDVGKRFLPATARHRCVFAMCCSFVVVMLVV